MKSKYRINEFGSVFVSKGYALVATLSIMTLLVLIALAMLSLATSSSKTSVSVAHLERAKSNARVALIEAIAALQEALGPDTRVSANSAIIDDGSRTIRNQHILGVWDSTATMLPSLVVSNETSNAKLTASYDEHRITNFRRWLVPGASSVESGSSDLAARRKAMDYHVVQASGHKEIKLVGKGTVGQSASEDLHVTAPLIEVDDNGAYSWWISGENQKARVAIDSTRWDHVANAESHASNLVNLSGAPSFNLNTFADLVNYNESGAKKHVSFESALLDSGDRIKAKKLYHSISPYSVGLFTNTAWGGVKKDLSLASEYDGLPADMGTKIRMGRDKYYSSTSPYKNLLNYCRSYKSPEEGGVVVWDYADGVHLPTLCVSEPIDNSDTGFGAFKSNPNWEDRLPIMTRLCLQNTIGL